MTTNDLSKTAYDLHELANNNLSVLSGNCTESLEKKDYYLGILRRHAILLKDLSDIFKDRETEYISTPFIILRCLIDDFLHLLYLECHADTDTEITKINADSYRHSFISLSDLTDSNYEHFDGKYSFYLSKKQLNNLKKQFASKEKNRRYFRNVEKFSFSIFRTVTNMVKSYSYSRNVDIFKARAFYLWQEFSSFTHYSNYTFEYELNNAAENLSLIDESFQYCYNSIYLSFKYFERTLNIDFQDDTKLREQYGIILEC